MFSVKNGLIAYSQALAKRLIEKKPVLNQAAWKQHSSEHTKLRNSISKFVELPADEYALLVQ